MKIRGVRIELAEVEKAIGEHSRVEIAAVSAVERDGEALLCAYVVPRSGMAVSERDLRGFLRAKLPLAMIPAEFLFLDSLPLSPNGKIDRKALHELSTPSVPLMLLPRSNTERQLAEIWGEILKMHDFGVQDEFFDCGGDSLSAIALLLAIERKFAKRVSLDDLLGNCTIESLAKALDGAPPDSERSHVAAAAVTRSRNDVTCRLATLVDVPEIWQVCRRSFPAYADTSVQDFRDLCKHRWLNNPFRTEHDPLGWVLEAADGRIVGFHGLVPTRLWLGDRSFPAVSPSTWTTEPGYGKFALRLLSEYMHWGESRFC